MPPRSDIEAMDRPILYYIIYDISYGYCTTDEPFCVRWQNIFEYITRRLIYHTIHNEPCYRFLSVRTCISICPLILPTWWYRLVYIRTHHNQGSFLFTALRCSCANAAYKVVQTKVHNCVDGFS